MQDLPQRSSILIKRYTQTRFFDTCAAEYCSMDELRHLAETGVCFVVIDVTTGEDVTQSLIAQAPERMIA